MATVERAADLYGLPPEEFAAARNALSKRLSAEGEREAAAEVRKLRKPSRTAWALNQLARQRPDDIDELLARGAALREAQARALAGDATALRPAAREEQQHVDMLVDAAASLMGEQVSPSTTDRLRNTLRAAAIDDDAAAQLRDGRLTGDLDAAGLGLEQFAGELPGQPTPGRRHEREAEKELSRLRAEAKKMRERARRLVEEAERAEQRAREARADAAAAEDEAAAAERAAVAAADRLATARRG